VSGEPVAPLLLDQTVGAYLDAVGSSRPVPASGTTAALVGAAAAALLEKAAAVSTEWPGRDDAGRQARALRDRLAALAPADVDAYEDALAAVRGASGLSPEQRELVAREAFAGAADVPLAIAEAAADTAVLAMHTAAGCKPSVRPDAVAAALLAEAAARAAALLVEANLASAPDDGRIARAAAARARAVVSRADRPSGASGTRRAPRI
jgi:formiminotetrahydrofolate cyclodeaminase